MQNIIIHQGVYANLLWVVLGVTIVAGVGFVLRRRALGKFVSLALRPLLLPTFSESRHWMKAGLAIAALVAIVLGLVDIRWGRQWRDIPQSGVEVIFVLDVSRSMLATDTSPTRLDRAKQYIADVVDQLEGDRVGLFVFAGQPRQKVPLTSNYHDFALTLNEVGPHSAPRGGSRLGDAITAAAHAFVDTTPDHKAIVVFTDGEDQASDPVGAARQAYENKGIVIYTVGLGDMDQGTKIRLADHQYVEYKGKPVVTRMDGKILKSVALAGGGAFVPAGTRWVDMGEVYRTHIGQIATRDFADAHVQTWTPRYIWFVGVALVLLLVDEAVRARRRQGAAAQIGATSTWGLVLVGMLSLSVSTSAWAQTSQERVHQANVQLEAGDQASALQAYRDMDQMLPGSPQLAFNEAVTLYRLGDLDAARQRFRDSLDHATPALRAKARFNLGNIAYAQALKIKDKDRSAAITQLKTAIIHYRDALGADPHDTDARANIELARRLIDQLKQAQKEEQKQKKQSQKSKSPSQDQKQKDQQKKQGQKQDQKQGQSQKNSQQKQHQKPSSSNSDSQEPKNSSPGKSASKTPGKDDSPMTKPQDGKSSDDKPQPSDLTKGKPQAENETSQTTQGQAMSPQETKGTLTSDEAAKLLQAIRDKEYQRRARQQWVESQRQRRVERDW